MNRESPSRSFLCVAAILLVTSSCAYHSRPGQPTVRHEISAAGAGASIDVEYIPAQRFDDPVQDPRLIFPVKFLCGEAREGDRLTPAHYRTVINVLNVGHGFSAVIQWWFVTLERTVQGAQAVVKATSSLVMDCDFILQNFANAGVDVSGLVEGFVLLEETTTSPGFFRVSAVYSTLHKQRHSLPDLLPVRKAAGYCTLDKDGRLLVTIRNAGEVAANASTATVSFGNGSSVARMTPTLAAGAETTLAPIPLPSGEGTHTFKIAADSLTQIMESDELNNVVQGFCTIIK